MNYKLITILLLVIGLVVVAGCTNADARYNNVQYNPQGQPAPAAGGCGVAAPLESGNANVVVVQPGL